MPTIKPKKGWDKFIKPRAPKKPTEPLKEFTHHEDQFIKSIDTWSEIPLSQLPLPEGVSLSDLVIKIEGIDCDDDYSHSINAHICARKIITQPNPRYESEMKKYQKNIEEYEKRKKAHAQEIKEWKEWVQQENDSILQKNLENAEKLLREHGRLK